MTRYIIINKYKGKEYPDDVTTDPIGYLASLEYIDVLANGENELIDEHGNEYIVKSKEKLNMNISSPDFNASQRWTPYLDRRGQNMARLERILKNIPSRLKSQLDDLL